MCVCVCLALSLAVVIIPSCMVTSGALWSYSLVMGFEALVCLHVVAVEVDHQPVLQGHHGPGLGVAAIFTFSQQKKVLLLLLNTL